MGVLGLTMSWHATDTIWRDLFEGGKRGGVRVCVAHESREIGEGERGRLRAVTITEIVRH